MDGKRDTAVRALCKSLGENYRGKTINYAGGVKNMTHRIFYGSDFKLNDSDKKMFSKDGYECKDLLQG